MTSDYRGIEYRLHENLVQLQEMLCTLEFEQCLIDRIADCKDLIKSKQYNVAVMGEFKRGKSSLINALLGARILPADATPTTATVNRITYSPSPRAVVTFRDGSSQEIPIENLTDYVTKLTADGEARAMLVRDATVYLPAVICQNHIDIIDTPGLNDEPHMTQITIDMISNVDAVVVPIHARIPFSDTEKKFVCQLMESDSIHQLIFVVTFMDQLDEDDYEYSGFIEYIRERIQSGVMEELVQRQSSGAVQSKAKRILEGLHIIGISSSQALEAFVSGNQKLLEKSRFEDFRNMLLQVVTAKQLENAVQKTVDTMCSVVAQFSEQDLQRRAAFDAERLEIETHEERFRRYRADGAKMLDAVFAADYDGLVSLANGLNNYKNQIVNEFITSLSQVRENSHAAILAALNCAAHKAEQDMNHRKRILHKEIYDVFLSSFSVLRKQETMYLASAVEFAGISNWLGFADVGISMMRHVETALVGTKFSWRTLYVPPVQDLSSYNVIETVIHAVDVLIMDYINQIHQATAAIRKNWFAEFSVHTRALLQAAAEVIPPRYEAHDLRQKAYIRNYQVFSDGAREILRGCESIQNEAR
ncbi:dynamin family protein [Oscillospiraceae bacterium MB08-C2-2]|nr:dynamin family protein [Oscillospiraceae bacterium MB08-C2-2]